MQEIISEAGAFSAVFIQITRYLLPALALWVLLRCARSLLFYRKEPEIWAWLTTPENTRLPVTHWENLLGRSAGCDVVLQYATVSRIHAVLTRSDKGSWTITDAGSKSGIAVNGASVSSSPVGLGDEITLGGLRFSLVPITKEQEAIQAEARSRITVSPALTLLLLTAFQLLVCVRLLIGCPEQAASVLLSFGCLIGAQWLLLLGMKVLHRCAFELETLAFFLTTMGLCVVTVSAPEALRKELLAIGLGILVFLFVGWSLRDLRCAKAVRYLAAVAGIGLLAVNLLIGTEKFGAKNWIELGAFSFQPSELVKLCFVYVGASSLSHLVARRNLTLFIVYSASVCACLALMNDFGAAIIFFVTFLVIAFLRSGNFATLALACAGTGFAGLLALRFKPYAMNRFSAWGHVWENATTTGYSQTRALMCLASGGLFGLGAGKGWLHYVGAADTDLVFALVSEEWGLLLALCMVLAVVILAMFAVRASSHSRSCFYTIGSCAAASILIIQCILNVFGTTDLLPLTGVTFPFVSNGGSSMLCVWGLLAFIKAADTRQNASFTVRLPNKRIVQEEETE